MKDAEREHLRTTIRDRQRLIEAQRDVAAAQSSIIAAMTVELKRMALKLSRRDCPKICDLAWGKSASWRAAKHAQRHAAVPYSHSTET